MSSVWVGSEVCIMLIYIIVYGHARCLYNVVFRDKTSHPWPRHSRVPARLALKTMYYTSKMRKLDGIGRVIQANSGGQWS